MVYYDQDEQESFSNTFITNYIPIERVNFLNTGKSRETDLYIRLSKDPTTQKITINYFTQAILDALDIDPNGD